MAKDDLKLRIMLNSMVKFYLKVSPKSSLDGLKSAIEDILTCTYGVSLHNYSIRCSEGFEVLDMYPIGELIDNNQILVIDPYTSSAARGFIREDGIKSSRSSRVTLKQEQPIPVYPTNERIYTSNEMYKKSSPSFSNPIKGSISISSGGAVQDLKPAEIINPIKKSPSVEKPQEPISVETKQDLAEKEPPKPDNFKGFVINKVDMNKSQGLKIDESSFKPLKKRRVDIERIDVEL